ncbi:MAG: CRISPR-associated endonuclease Cas2 [Candidatus Doudnabacteria bacterium RIFCSPLOWO2_02_FULL_49_13]|uniref:CRISPR-associated endonuclease Cas2 n=1 Tax=Candidatus Doudnabacteria bacterium RIFCSPHIGHO2_12_FULL_48_16 TaxID=1817838 RepID=A0A1F5PLC5_9BACT|nr:MAG: CRISPR-associated endonuclease Cas2 [Candidatus Doudnabacteria bacterium RIFCSPHIGHO2_02_FULL_49_24]OGE90711.1 MAG: CRISPR-associated endonuclease Cas2 [Candidatus Doudnabacteria bacterium RIFCSPHIGHO2_12_FULL_48_16]OGF02575.1 MAG: CRISPR-associated endonuclease Cas2 [Candidatus Doudnabacteria bacterium RIFCSPLOWO2_02_FULL_49_13]OGF02645.1 MAG: CRISPR-associated endonuclease Cas2 [Candidatus Doudnabacteria bacterium RIFCSPLOWO2_12_FULL_49_8]
MKESQKYLTVQVLKLLGMGVTLTAVSLLSPTFVYGALKRYVKYRLNQPYKREQIRKAVNYLKQKRFIAYQTKSAKKLIILTKAGQRRLLELKILELKIKKISWDQQWRLVTFDIPENDKAARFRFCRMLKDLGFFHFQRSVFILPYACDKQISLITEYLKIDAYVHILTTKRFRSDHQLIKHFRLK